MFGRRVRLPETSTTFRDFHKPVLTPPPPPTRALCVMVSSTVTGQEDRLSQVYNALRGLGYEVWMSARGTLPVGSHRNNLDNCLAAVDAADVVLVLINHRYGSVSADSADGLSVFHEEVRRAVDADKPRFTLVHTNVELASRLYAPLRTGAPASWMVPGFAPVDGVLEDLRVLDVYDYALQRHIARPVHGNWVQPFPSVDALVDIVTAQFRDPARIAAMVAAH